MKFPDAPAAPFLPPFPPRLPARPSNLALLSLARRDFLALWEEEAFNLEFSQRRLLSRMIFVCNSPRAVQFALSEKNASFERKSPQMRHALRPLLGDGLFISDGETWRQRRRVISPIVHVSKLADFAPTMVETAVEHREILRAKLGRTTDVLADSAHLTAEIISRTVFGRDLGRKHAGEVVEGFTEFQQAVDQIDIASLIGIPDWVPRYRSPKVRRSIARIHSVLDGIIASARASSHLTEGSVIGRLLNAKDESGAPLSAEAIRNEAAVLFMAGHETTANTLTWVWYLLSQSPAVESKLHAEIDSVLGGRIPSLADVPKLAYTRAVIDEALRLYPPVPILARECLIAEEFEGHAIPKGSLVTVVPWLLHRHRKLWTSPDHFIPERFLPDSSEPVSKFAYVPFGIGPRICLGLSFGLVEAVLCVATLAQTFRLELQAGHQVQPTCRLTLRPAGGMPMVVRARTDKSSAPAASVSSRTPMDSSAKCPFTHG